MATCNRYTHKYPVFKTTQAIQNTYPHVQISHTHFVAEAASLNPTLEFLFRLQNSPPKQWRNCCGFQATCVGRSRTTPTPGKLNLLKVCVRGEVSANVVAMESGKEAWVSKENSSSTRKNVFQPASSISTRKKFTVGLVIVTVIACSWVGSTQTSKSVYSGSNFSAPFFNMWFGTAWMILLFPLTAPFYLIRKQGNIKELWT